MLRLLKMIGLVSLVGGMPGQAYANPPTQNSIGWKIGDQCAVSEPLTIYQSADLSGEPRQEVSGDLPEDLTEWSGVIHVTDNLTLPTGGTLRILPGTLVLIDGVDEGTDGTDFNVRGQLESLGTRQRPVTFTANNPEEAWGEMDHDGEEESIYRYTILTRAGNAPEGGHTDSDAKAVARHAGANDEARNLGATVHHRHDIGHCVDHARP